MARIREFLENGEHGIIKEQIDKFHELRISFDILGLSRADYKKKVQAISSADSCFFSNELKLNCENFFRNFKRISARLENGEPLDFSNCSSISQILTICAKAFFAISARDFLDTELANYHPQHDSLNLFSRSQEQEIINF